MKNFSLLPLLCALLVPAALSAAEFEGTVTMKVNNGSTIDLSMKNGMTRVDMPGREGAAIMNPSTHEMTVLVAQRKMYMTMPIPTAPAPADDQGNKPTADLQKTGETEKILGYNATKYLVTDKEKGKTYELWLTDELGTFMGLSPGGPMGRGRGAIPPGWEALLKGKDFFPMRVVTVENGKETDRMEVTAVEKKSLPDSLFSPPEGWQDMSAMMRGMPGAMRPGGN